MTPSSLPLTCTHPRYPGARITAHHDGFITSFKAMASDCEILLETSDKHIGNARALTDIAVQEVWRIEEKFSRYRSDNAFADLHRKAGEWQTIDEETYRLLAFAAQAWELSDGLFDITSGILRTLWTFDGSDRIPAAADVDNLLPRIGWQKIELRLQQEQPQLLLPEGMELDFGGIGKEYAVDRALGLMLSAAQQKQWPVALLVNLGGDIACSGPRLNGESWTVGIERPDRDDDSIATLRLAAGGLATSGDSKRYLLKDGIRYSHILNPKTGWPITHGPRSVTVAAPTCVQSGLIATLALLQGENAEAFLQKTGLKYWLIASDHSDQNVQNHRQ